jgi:DAK2 domain fusion protein YloV
LTGEGSQSDLDVPQEVRSVVKCDGQCFKEALAASALWLAGNVEVVNTLNHFPVPDEDTGTNLLNALNGAVEGMGEISDSSISLMARAAAEGAHKRAEGHAGVILSLLLAGLAEGLPDKESLDSTELAEAMVEASVAAYNRTPQPVEGTILTVARQAAEAARLAAREGESIDRLLERALIEAKESVTRTPSLLPALEEAGVVDAGGQGLYLILQGALRFVRGERVAPPQKIELDLPFRQAEERVVECDGQLFKRLLEAGTIWLERHVPLINALNVYPVPDGDTGTNMLLTMRAALEEIAHSPEQAVGDIAQAVSYGALMGARGNSGVILSQILRGLARSLDDKQIMGTAEFAAAMKEAAATAYKGVMKPVEGTILTVIREAAEMAEAVATETDDLRYVLQMTVHEAKASVARTPSLLPVLKEAGVVDAGGQGLLALLEGFLRYIQGETMEYDSTLEAAVALNSPAEEEYGYDVQFVLKGDNLELERIRTDIDAMGESTLVVGDSTTIKVHVHTPEPGTPLNYAVRLGSLSKIIVENMQDQYQEFMASKAVAPSAEPSPTPEDITNIATVAVAPGAGLIRVFESLGASAVVPGGQTMNPSTEELLTAINNLTADDVLILPNNPNIILSAQQAQALSDKNVRMVPTKTIPQGVCALLAFNYQEDLETNASLMEQAAASVQTIEITTAVRDAQINGLQVQKGDIIGLLNDTLVTSGHTLEEVVYETLRQVEVEEYEIVTVYYGDGVTQAQAESLGEDISQRYPDLEVELINGGQSYYHYILSVE